MPTAIQIRDANINDIGVMWDWYNEPLRVILFPKTRTAEKAKCRDWFRSELANKNNLCVIGLIDIVRFGAIRFRGLGSGSYEATVFMKPAYMAQGLVPIFLKQAISRLRAVRPTTHVFLSIPSVNPASRAIFEREGFELVSRGTSDLMWEQRW